MPVYEYRCQECESLFEALKRLSDPAPEKCPRCGHAEVRKVVSRSSFALKGGGWYSDHYGLRPSASPE